MKTIYLLLPLIVWLFISFIEISMQFFTSYRPMIFRAWEFVLNEGKDSYYIPFQPHLTYDDKMTGDLLLLADFYPKSTEIRDQHFQVDEYGFRNRIGLLDSGIDAVIIGTSFVGGAQETQNHLISEKLTDIYNIRTYNYATLPLQHFWEDSRFIDNPPKYILIVGNESEFLQNSWIEVLSNSTARHEVKKWSSHDVWKKVNNPLILEYDHLEKQLKRYSFIRFLAKDITRYYKNEFFSRADIAKELVKDGMYDPERDILFFDINSFDPRVNSSTNKTVEDTITTLKKTRDVLHTRNITMIIAVVPSKSNLHANRYKDLPINERAVSILQNELSANGIHSVDISRELFLRLRKSDQLFYYPDDSHWNTSVNELLSELLATKIKELDKK